MPQPKRGRSKQLRLWDNVRWSNVHVDIHGEGDILLLLHSASLAARGNNRSIDETASCHAPIDLRILKDYSTYPDPDCEERNTFRENIGRAIPRRAWKSDCSRSRGEVNSGTSRMDP